MKTRRRTWICMLLAISLLLAVLVVKGPGRAARRTAPADPADGEVATPMLGERLPEKELPGKRVGAISASHVAKDTTGAATKPASATTGLDDDNGAGRNVLEAVSGTGPAGVPTAGETGK